MTEKQQPLSPVTYLSYNKPHGVYLIIYSHLDEEKFPTRESFGRACAMAYGENKVLYLACATEDYKVTNAEHYNVAIRLYPSQRSKIAKEFLHENHGIVASFASSPKDGMYAATCRYTSKEDPNIFHGNCLQKPPQLSIIGKNKVAALENAACREKKRKIN